MAVKTLDSRDEGGGHKSFDFALEIPKEGIKDTEAFKLGIQIAQEISGTVNRARDSINRSNSSE
jgi:hypothetical protein